MDAGEGHSEGQRHDEPLWGLADISNGFLKVLPQVWFLHSPSADRLQFLQFLPLGLPELPCGPACTPGNLSDQHSTMPARPFFLRLLYISTAIPWADILPCSQNLKTSYMTLSSCTLRDQEVKISPRCCLILSEG